VGSHQRWGSMLGLGECCLGRLWPYFLDVCEQRECLDVLDWYILELGLSSTPKLRVVLGTKRCIGMQEVPAISACRCGTMPVSASTSPLISLPLRVPLTIHPTSTQTSETLQSRKDLDSDHLRAPLYFVSSLPLIASAKRTSVQ
jgi:hypothetical protein